MSENIDINESYSLSYNNTTVSVRSQVEELVLVGLLSVVIVITIIGNTLVIMAVLTTRRLRTVTNCFVMSLATADWLVGILVMPPAVRYHLVGFWEWGWILCDMWISLDILLCTASILSLCVISVDRYLAVTQPLSYSRKRRSKRLAFSMILTVWISSLLITCPPMFGWYEPGKHKDQVCRYNRNTGYVVFSSMCSFFIPMVIMVYVYARISCVVAQRHDQLAHIDNRNKKSQKIVLHAQEESEIDRRSSEDYGDPNTRCPGEPLNQQQNHADQRKNGSNTQSRTIRPTLSYTGDLVTPPQRASFYRTPFVHKRHESLHLESSVFSYEPATRVSSFRRETKTAQTLSIVVGGFIACWLPFFICYLLTAFLPSNATVMNYLTWLGWINSAINPFIYAFYSPDFRIAFWRLTCRHLTKKDNRAEMSFQHK